MRSKSNSDPPPDDLRDLAETLCRATPPAPYADLDPLRLLQELEIHRIELQLQNEELRQARATAEAALARYTELYDFAPVGYFSLAPNGVIQKANIAGADLLGVPRALAVGRRFAEFIDAPCVALFADFLERVFEGRGGVSRELTLISPGSAPVLTRIDGSLDPSGRVCHAVLLDITQLKQAEHTIWRQANHDALTDLPNRRLFHDRLQQNIGRTARESRSLALLLLDLDRFKEVNDSLGHVVGDQLLVQAARRIGACLRSTDTVARLGGDEFAIIMDQLTDTDRVNRVAQSVIQALARPFRIAGQAIHISASIGIALYPTDTTIIDDLLKNADQAMYLAKEQGRNRFCYFTQQMQAAAQAHLDLIEHLRGALARRELEVYFQPIVELATERFVKAEALLRWNHPQRGWVSPAEFIPVAEDMGLISPMGDWVFREAARWARAWLDQGADWPIQININLSPLQFAVGDACKLWVDHLRRIGLPGANIGIEVTESVLLEDNLHTAERLRQFHAAGMQIAIDDFGTGYASLAYLKKFAIDLIKIDRVFVRNLGTDPKDSILVEAIIAMAHKLGMQVVAEGVENTQQRDLLHMAGCDYGQGYLFARPMPQQDMAAFLRGDGHGKP